MVTGETPEDLAGPGQGRSLASPAFPADDGRADPRVRALLAAPDVDAQRLARELRSTRLFASVVAVADDVDASGADKDSHMAVVSMLNERGERGLLVFTGTDSLAAWDPQARPVPALGRDIARSALSDGAAAVVLDVAGPARTVIAGSDLHVMADLLDLETVAPLLWSALSGLMAEGRAEIGIRDARLESTEVDVLVDVLVEVSAGLSSREVSEQVAALLAGHAEIARAVPGGIGVIVAGSIGA